MSTQPVHVAKPRVLVMPPAKQVKPKKASNSAPNELKPLHVGHKPSAKARASMRMCVTDLLDEGFSYIEIIELIQVYSIEAAVKAARGIKTTAASRLKISREYLQRHSKRGKGLI